MSYISRKIAAAFVKMQMHQSQQQIEMSNEITDNRHLPLNHKAVRNRFFLRSIATNRVNETSFLSFHSTKYNSYKIRSASNLFSGDYIGCSK